MKKATKRVAIANRGEVAVRIIHACEELGLETVLLHSEPDMGSKAYRMATKTICIGPAASGESYLNIEANIKGALAGGADAIHPGFGFLSENASFAEAVEKAGMVFVGPSADSIRRLGDKVQCKALAKAGGLPLVPGYEGEDQSLERLMKEVEKIGYPVIVKAAAGGGGRGMKLIRQASDAQEAIESAQREARSAFGSSKVFLEKYLDRAKHIEFQVFGDSTGRVVHLFDRECSVQRRHQKIIEEATSPSLTEALRRQMGEAAAAIATLGKYKGAGTVEFLLQDGEFHLLEVNTRLQVEHPVTEMVLGVDLVKAQLLTAMDEFVFDDQPRIPRGHSIECRVYAENPYLGGIPSTGLLGTVKWPEGPGRRFEYGFEKGDEITPYYDPMIAKVIVWDESRPRAIRKMIHTLKESVVFGVHTNIPFLIEILNHAEFVNGTMTTRFIEKYFPGALPAPEMTNEEKALVERGLKQKPGTIRSSSTAVATQPLPWQGYWRGV
ncbi:MAG TPA: biotin carboxylase N-terminal domain-containing protein [Pseudobdellovibrionaceae bacterium]|nr:biotin carboxylase N-terminal domain-containing protein [Pseudobdellovibrionaceae bacterium]